MRTDVYQKITNRIVAELERGVRPWFKPWSAGNTEGKIVRPLRASAQRTSCTACRNMPPSRKPREACCGKAHHRALAA